MNHGHPREKVYQRLPLLRRAVGSSTRAASAMRVAALRENQTFVELIPVEHVGQKRSKLLSA
jgi:hypothetical protein